MSQDYDLKQLTEYFRALGARDPETWAKSQTEEGIPHYARFVFLQHAWTRVVAEDDTTWIDSLIQRSERRPRDPGAGIGPALRRLLDSGAARQDIAEVVRVMQWHVLAALTLQLDDPSVVAYPTRDLPRVNWTLFEVSEEGEPLRSIDGLHESVLDTDPSGREMRPNGAGREG
jgi:hypothetical protein